MDRELDISGLLGGLGSRRNVVLAAAATLAITIVCTTDLGTAIRGKLRQGAARLETVAAMFGERSPGERTPGTLANLKHKRQTASRQTALPKALHARLGNVPATLVSAPSEKLPVDSGSFYQLPSGMPALADPQETIVDVTSGTPAGLLTTPSGAAGSAPGGIPLLNGNQQASPISSNAPAVPEPSSWIMMLIGFAMTGLTVRRNGALFGEAGRS